MKVLLSFISIATLLWTAGGCHCQKNVDSKTELNKNNATAIPSSMTIVLDSAILNKKLPQGQLEIIHIGPEQSKTDSIKTKKNKLKIK